MDISKLSDSDLQQIAKGDLRMVSEEGLRLLASTQATPQTQAPKQNAGSMANIIAGGFKGASDIGATLLRPVDWALNKTGLTETTNEQRRQSLQDFFAQNFDPQSMAFKGGELAADVAGTAGVGGVLAKGAMAVPALARFAPALESGGFRLGTAPAKTAADVAKNIATRVGAGGVVGGATAGLVNPDQAGTGAMIGAAMPPVVTAAGAIGKAVKSAVIDPLVNQDAILAKTLLRAVGPENVGQLTGAVGNAPMTQGVGFTVGQRTGNPAILSIEDALKATNPGGPLTQQSLNNNTILANTLRNIAKDEGAISAATAAREVATNPLYNAAKQSTAAADPSRVVRLIDRIVEKNPANKALVSPLSDIRNSLFEKYPIEQRGSDAWKAVDQYIGGRMSNADSVLVRSARTVMDRVRKGSIGTDEALSQLSQLKPTSKTAIEAIDVAKQYMKTPDYVLMQDPVKIISAIDNIKAMLGNKENAFVIGQLTTIKKALSHQLSKAVPEYKAAEQTFATMSQPINQMQVGQLLANKLIPSTAGDIPSRLNAASLATAMRNPNEIAKAATGFKRAKLENVLTPDQLKAVQGVTSDVSRIADTASLGAGFGSPTARRQAVGNFIGQNLANEFPVTSQVIGLLGNVPVINLPLRAASSVGSMVGNKINQSMATKLEDVLASNPDELIRLLQQAQGQYLRASGALPQSGLNPMLRSGLLNYPGLTQATP